MDFEEELLKNEEKFDRLDELKINEIINDLENEPIDYDVLDFYLEFHEINLTDKDYFKLFNILTEKEVLK